jgi:GTP-binding protein EngB required for normal cell division
MTATRFQQARQAARAFKMEAVSLLESGGAEFSRLASAASERVVIDERALTLAMAGEYSVGKSSLIEALTGQQVPVGAGVTTVKVYPYPYQDLLLVDMPGTLSGQMEHDETAMRAITDADLILFVVSNELFNKDSLPYFKLAAEKLAKKHQMLLVVNKFDRFNLAQRTPEKGVEFITGVLAEQIQPLRVNEFGPVVVSTRDYLSAHRASDVQKRKRLLATSRFDTLVSAIDDFSARRGVIAQQLRPLQQLLEILEEALTVALADDGSRSRAEALVRRRIFALTEARSLARIEFRQLRDKARGRFVQPSEKLLKLIDEKVTQEEMDTAAIVVEAELERVVKTFGDELTSLCEKLVADIRDRLQEIDASPLAGQVRAEFEVDFDRPEIGNIGGGMSVKQRKTVAAGMRNLANSLTKNSKQVADALGKIFKFFGGKFKPWGKVKLGKFIGKAGKVLGPLVAVGEAYMNYREEETKEQAERQLRTLRAELRAQFADAASQFDGALREQEEAILKDLYEKPLSAAQHLASEILQGDEAKTQFAERLTKLLSDISMRIDKLAA